MKQLNSILLVLMMSIGLVACGDEKVDNQVGSQKQVQQVDTASPNEIASTLENGEASPNASTSANQQADQQPTSENKFQNNIEPVASSVQATYWTPPTEVSKNFTIAEVERNYLQCLRAYGAESSQLCEDYCTAFYNESSCATVENYYSNRYGVGKEDSFVDEALLFSAGYVLGSMADNNKVIVNNHYGKPVRKIDPKHYNARPVRVVSPASSKVVTNKTTVIQSKTVTSPVSSGRVEKINPALKQSSQYATSKPVSTATVKSPSVSSGTVQKINTGGVEKQKSQFSASKPVAATTTSMRQVNANATSMHQVNTSATSMRQVNSSAVSTQQKKVSSVVSSPAQKSKPVTTLDKKQSQYSTQKPSTSNKSKSSGSGSYKSSSSSSSYKSSSSSSSYKSSSSSSSTRRKG